MENKPNYDPEMVIFNFSKVSLTEAEKSFSVKILSFFVPPKQHSYSNQVTNFELFYKSIENLILK